MTAQYENQGGLLVKPNTHECAGYIFNFTGHGAYGPTKVETLDGGPTQAEIDAHNAILSEAEREAMVKNGVGTFYLSYDAPTCTSDNPRWKQENAGTWHYSNYRVTQWSGDWRAPWCHVRRGYSYGFCRVKTHWVWFTGPDGKKWYGVNKGNQQCFTGRRMKRQ